MILITGGMGFIGLHTARRFLDAGENVVVTLFNTRREPDFIKDEIGKRVFVERVDVTSHHDMIEVARKHKVTGVVHLAVPGLAALTPAEDYRTNMMGLINVLEAARIAEVPRVTFASSLAVYTGLREGPFREDAPLPIASGNPTETFKKAWEILGLHYGSRTGIEVVAGRAATIWGPLYHTLMNLPSRVCHAAAKGAAVDFTGSRAGQPYAEDVGDLTYVKDCALGFYLLQTAKTLSNRIYNVGSGVPHTNRELVEAARKVVPTLEVDLLPGQSPRARPNGYVDTTRIAQELGYKPEYTLERAVAEYINWVRKNPF